MPDDLSRDAGVDILDDHKRDVRKQCQARAK
jgi:hypothetical protein